MRKITFQYLANASEAVNAALGDQAEFEDQISEACGADAVTQISVRTLTPGLSGAAVFLVRRIGRGGRLNPWVVKVSKNFDLIIAERDNYRNYVKGRLPSATDLISVSSSRILIIAFGGAFADHDPCTLSNGYEKTSIPALVSLMRRLVISLKSLHHFNEDSMSCAERINEMRDVAAVRRIVTGKVGPELGARVSGLWADALADPIRYPNICSTAHGDLNAGNVLFVAGDDASFPVLIDFASMRRSKDNYPYPDGYHLPFWDYAKIERDMQTRLFLREASSLALGSDAMIATVRALNGIPQASLPDSPPARKLMQTTWALRDAVRRESVASSYCGSYRIVLAFGMLSVMLRSQPDSNLDPELQHVISAEAICALLNQPFSALPDASSQGDVPTNSRTGASKPRRRKRKRGPSSSRTVRVNAYKLFWFRSTQKLTVAELSRKSRVKGGLLSRLEGSISTLGKGSKRFFQCSRTTLERLEKALNCERQLEAGQANDFLALYVLFYHRHRRPGIKDPFRKSEVPIQFHTRVVAFDFDGTLTRNTSGRSTWERLWVALGYSVEDCADLHRRYERKEFSHQEWCNLTRDKFKERGLNEEHVKTIARETQLIDGTRETLEHLKRRGVKLYILSGSVKQVIKLVLGDLYDLFDGVKANDMQFDSSGVISNISGTKYDFVGKAEFLRHVITSQELSELDVLFVGNSCNDRWACESGARTLCVNPHLTNPDEEQCWNNCIKELKDVREILAYTEL